MLIKKNRNLQHLNMAECGLEEQNLRALIPAIAKSKSLLAVHLCGNPGLTWLFHV